MNYTRDDIEETRLELNREQYDEQTSRVAEAGWTAVDWLVGVILVGLVVVPLGAWLGWWEPL